jgi:hypothetical protein
MMKLHGKLSDNLMAAAASARRLRGHPVYSDTMQFWSELLAHARAELRSHPDDEEKLLEPLLSELQAELAARE